MESYFAAILGMNFTLFDTNLNEICHKLNFSIATEEFWAEFFD
jgi:hypothetical protein